MTNLAQLGSKIQRFRVQMVLSEDEVEERTGISADIIKGIESGTSAPSGDQLLILAELFNQDYKYFLSNDVQSPLEQTESLYRRYGNYLSREDRWAIQEVLFFCETEEYLQNELGRRKRQLPSVDISGTYFKAHGWTAAKQIRAALDQAGKQVPVNVFQLFRSLGIHIFRRRLSTSEVSGIFMKHPVAGPCILVNYHEDEYRQRFTVAHEAAHAILDASETDPLVTLNSDHSALREVRADAFAGAFLVAPAAISELSLDSMSRDSFIAICHKLRVNAKTLLIAFEAFNGANNEATQRFSDIKLARSTKDDPELGPDLTDAGRARRQALLERGLSYPYLRLCLDAYREDKISLLRLSEVLLMDLDETIQVMRSFGEVVRHRD
ncbi:MAG: XRE family transcriptional regulator [Fimbriimonas sp.]|nr:XRE family transcriptional regulator [Fimbriimonas sp.]